MVVANSTGSGILEDIIGFKTAGTFFAPQISGKVKSLKKWIAFGVKTKGSIYLDSGAVEAVKNKGRSILPVGILKVEGRFEKGESLRVCDPEGNILGKGISNFSNEEITGIIGKNGRQIKDLFGKGLCTEVIHRDNLVVFKENGFEEERE
jgi:glutamate 5-kinase